MALGICRQCAKLLAKICLPLIILLSLQNRLILVDAMSQKIVNSTRPYRPTFIVNFDIASVICQKSSDQNDLRIFPISVLCDGKNDCFQSPGMDDETFPYCSQKCKFQCGQHGTCLMDAGKSLCYCDAEYSGKKCDIPTVSECSEKKPCHWLARCTNTVDSHLCTCLPGFEGNGYNCTDVDECSYPQVGRNASKCPANSKCCNIPGSFFCNCTEGFMSKGSPFTACIDIDECDEGTAQCPNATSCVNLPGSYECSLERCKPGFELRNGKCTDVDECKSEKSTCDSRATCQNTKGSYTCSCSAGFSGDGKICSPLADCTQQPNVCHKKAACVQDLKMCICQSGYIGDGIQCYDINECSVDPPVCQSHESCLNLDGSYSCCPANQTNEECKAANGLICSESCGNNAVCKLGHCQCKAGFVGDALKGCTDWNECNSVKGICLADDWCVNLEGSYLCCNQNSTLAACQGLLIGIFSDFNVSTQTPTYKINDSIIFITEPSVKLSTDDQLLARSISTQISPAQMDSTSSAWISSISTATPTSFLSESPSSSIRSTPHDETSAAGPSHRTPAAGISGEGLVIGVFSASTTQSEVPTNSTHSTEISASTPSFSVPIEPSTFHKSSMDQTPHFSSKEGLIIGLFTERDSLENSSSIPATTLSSTESTASDLPSTTFSAPHLASTSSADSSTPIVTSTFSSTPEISSSSGWTTFPPNSTVHTTFSDQEGFSTYKDGLVIGIFDQNKTLTSDSSSISVNLSSTELGVVRTTEGPWNLSSVPVTLSSKRPDIFTNTHQSSTSANTTLGDAGNEFSTVSSTLNDTSELSEAAVSEYLPSLSTTPLDGLIIGIFSAAANASSSEPTATWTANSTEPATTLGFPCSLERTKFCQLRRKKCLVANGESRCTDCIDGYFLDQLGVCVENVTCFNATDCDFNANCSDLKPFGHMCTCKSGFIGDGHKCDDVDECYIPNTCSSNALCNNTVGGFICTCKNGFYGDGVTCIDWISTPAPSSSLPIIGCTFNPFLCDPNAECFRNFCVCRAGYAGDGLICAPDGFNCSHDGNPCPSGKICSKGHCERIECSSTAPNASLACQANSDCVNGRCICKVGFESHGPLCLPVLIRTPLSSATVSVPRPPVDGCNEMPDLCHKDAKCLLNRCVCNEGLVGSGFSCIPDPNDCVIYPTICHQDAFCQARRRCVCQPGFEGDGSARCDALPTPSRVVSVSPEADPSVVQSSPTSSAPTTPLSTKSETPSSQKSRSLSQSTVISSNSPTSPSTQSSTSTTPLSTKSETPSSPKTHSLSQSTVISSNSPTSPSTQSSTSTTPLSTKSETPSSPKTHSLSQSTVISSNSPTSPSTQSSTSTTPLSTKSETPSSPKTHSLSQSTVISSNSPTSPSTQSSTSTTPLSSESEPPSSQSWSLSTAISSNSPSTQSSASTNFSVQSTPASTKTPSSSPQTSTNVVEPVTSVLPQSSYPASEPTSVQSAATTSLERMLSSSPESTTSCWPPCHPTAQCLGGKCQCQRGFVGDGTWCAIGTTDCSVVPMICNKNALCTNKTCTCKSGFVGDGFFCSSDNETNCFDKSSDTDCHRDAACVDGKCRCRDGFVGDGLICHSATVTTIRPEPSGTATSEFGVTSPMPSALSTLPSDAAVSVTALPVTVSSSVSVPSQAVSKSASFPWLDGLTTANFTGSGEPSKSAPSETAPTTSPTPAIYSETATQVSSTFSTAPTVFTASPTTAPSTVKLPSKTLPSVFITAIPCHTEHATTEHVDLSRAAVFDSDVSASGSAASKTAVDPSRTAVATTKSSEKNCQENNAAFVCHPDARCADGRCVCKVGFKGDGYAICSPENSGDCFANPDLCHPDASCLRRLCQCNVNFVGNGTFCKPAPLSSCTPQFAKTCHKNAECVINSAHNEECICFHGFSGNGRICDDINECTMRIARCLSEASCVNTAGSFMCVCPDGYKGDGVNFCASATAKSEPIDVDCGKDGITLILANKTAFNGKMFVKGQSSNPKCSRNYTNFDGPHYNFTAIFAHCDVKMEDHNTVSTVVVIQRHPLFITEGDEAYKLRCTYPAGEITLMSHYNVSMLTPTSTLLHNGESPRCSLSLTSARSGQTVSEATVGDQLQLRLSVEPETFGLVAKNCLALNMENDETYKLTNSDGCAKDSSVFPQWQQANKSQVFANFLTFKWPDTAHIRFQCDCAPCVDHCEPVSCGGEKVYGRKKRFTSSRNPIGQVFSSVLIVRNSDKILAADEMADFENSASMQALQGDLHEICLNGGVLAGVVSLAVCLAFTVMAGLMLMWIRRKKFVHKKGHFLYENKDPSFIAGRSTFNEIRSSQNATVNCGSTCDSVSIHKTQNYRKA